MSATLLHNDSSSSSSDYHSMDMAAASETSSSDVEGHTKDKIKVTILTTAAPAAEGIKYHPAQQQEGVIARPDHPDNISHQINSGEDSCGRCCVAGCIMATLIFGVPILGLSIGAAGWGSKGILYGALIGIVSGWSCAALFTYATR